MKRLARHYLQRLIAIGFITKCLNDYLFTLPLLHTERATFTALGVPSIIKIDLWLLLHNHYNYFTAHATTLIRD